MSKKKKRQHLIQRREPRPPVQPIREPPRPPAPPNLRQDGLRAFKAGHYAAAISTWEKLDLSDSTLAAALAEAHFRQAVTSKLKPETLPDLERAAQLAPADPTYAYYLGLALHKAGRVAEAAQAYRRAVANGLSRRGAGVVIALAALELDPHADLASVPGVSPEDRQSLEPLVNYMQGKPQVKPPSSLLGGIAERLKITRPPALTSVFDGLVLMANQKTAEARQTLANVDAKGLPQAANAVRWYYIGVGAARAGDMAAALEAWKQAQRLPPGPVRLRDNLAAVQARRAVEQAAAGNWPAAAQSALDGLKLVPGDATLSHLALASLDRAAHRAAQAGDWKTAGRHWVEARQVLGDLSGGGTPRPILHNLALAYEAVEQWEDAAEAWRAMLRTKPRKKTLAGLSEDHWTWTRRRVIECYKRAGRPDEAIVVFRQALKVNPDDPDMQLGLAEALLANDQQQAALSEFDKLLKKHPDNVGALSRMAELYGAMEDWRSAEMMLRRALDVEPDDQEMQRRMAHVLVERGHAFSERRQTLQARTMYENALKFAPDDYNLFFNMAREEFNSRRPEAARRYIEHGLELSHDAPDAYEQAFICWVIENKLDEARAILARGEAAGKLTSNFYVHTGIACLENAAPPPDMPDPLDMILGRKPRPPRARPPKHAEMHRLGQELLDRAIALGPEIEALRHIIAELGPRRSNLSLPYAQRMTRCMPDDPMVWMTLGIVQATCGLAQEAQDTLRQAERLARKQGKYDLAREIKEAIRAVTDPYFSSVIKMAPLLEDMDFD